MTPEERNEVLRRVRAALDARTSGITVTPPPFEAMLARAEGKPPAPPSAAPLPLPSITAGPGGAVGGPGAVVTPAASAGSAGTTGAGASAGSSGGVSAASAVPAAAVSRRSFRQALGGVPAKLVGAAVIFATVATYFYFANRAADDCADGERCEPTEEVDAAGSDGGGPIESGDEGDGGGDDDEDPVGTDDTTSTSSTSTSTSTSVLKSSTTSSSTTSSTSSTSTTTSTSSTTTSTSSTTTTLPQPLPPATAERLQERAEEFVEAAYSAEPETLVGYVSSRCSMEQAIEAFTLLSPLPADFRPTVTSTTLDPETGLVELSIFIEEAGGDVGTSLGWEFVDDDWYPTSCTATFDLFGRGG